MHRSIGFTMSYGDKADNARMFASIVMELTGNWVIPIRCQDIQGQKRDYFDEVVFYGDKSDLEEGGVAYDLNFVA